MTNEQFITALRAMCDSLRTPVARMQISSPDSVGMTSRDRTIRIEIDLMPDSVRDPIPTTFHCECGRQYRETK